MQPGRLDLQPALVGTCVLSEDLEDDLRPVEHARLQLQLEVALLAGTQVLVADDQVERSFDLHVAQRRDLAHADEVRWIDLGSPLDVRADDLGAGRSGQVGQLGHLVTDRLWSRTREQDADEIGPLPRAPGRDQSWSFLIRFIASSRRASGAVTERRKYPSPRDPKPTPGVMLTPTWSKTWLAKPIES